MTRKDYELIAAALNTALNDVNGPGETTGIRSAIARIADALQADNPRFNPDLFVGACVLGQDDVSPGAGPKHRIR